MAPPAPMLIDDTPVSDPTQFIHSDWIGCGKTYPHTDTPAFILAARQEALAIPASHASLLPDPKSSVLDLLAFTLPSGPSVVVTLQQADRAFSFDEPTDDLKVLARRPVPSMKFLAKLQKAFGQAWFSGARSIVDGSRKHSRVPLQALTYWTEVQILLLKKAKWQSAEMWLTRWEREPDFLEEADHTRILLGSLPWSARVQALGSDTSADNLARLLSDDWLDDELVNMLTQGIYARARLDPALAFDVVVLPLALQQVLRNAATQNNYDHTLLRRGNGHITRGRSRLYFPVNLKGVHWVPCMIDMKERAIRYGQS